MDHCSCPGQVVLFEFLVVNNWIVTLEGMSLVAGSPWSANAFFLCYYVVVVVVVMNLLVAYVVDRFHEQHQLDHLQQQLLSTVAEDEKTIEDIRYFFEQFATTDFSTPAEETPEMTTTQQQRLSTQGLPVAQVQEVLKAINGSSKQVLQLNSSALEKFESSVAKVASDCGVICFEDFMDIMVETLKEQYQMEQLNVARTNRTL